MRGINKMRINVHQNDVLAQLIKETDEVRRETLEKLASLGDFQVVVKDEE